MPNLRFFEEVEVPHDLPFFQFPWRKPSIRKNDNINPRQKLFKMEAGEADIVLNS
jgi:hypothetical protein